jgi:hypothetical protein
MPIVLRWMLEATIRRSPVACLLKVAFAQISRGAGAPLPEPIGQSSREDPPGGRTYLGPETQVPGRPGPSRFRFDPPEPGDQPDFVEPAVASFSIGASTVLRRAAPCAGLTRAFVDPTPEGGSTI